MTQETFPMIVGGEETLNERTLLTQVESGLMGRTLSASSSYIAPLPKVTVTIRWNSFTVTIRYGDSVPSAIISISAGVES